MVKQLTNEEFEKNVKNSDKLVFVDFYADWCGPCRMMAPIVEEISEEVDGVDFYKVNCDDEQELASKYEVMTIPTLLILRKGEQIKEFIGVTDKEEIIEELNKLKGFFRKKLGSQLSMRFVPEIRIHLDDSVEYGVKIASILNEIKKKESE